MGQAMSTDGETGRFPMCSLENLGCIEPSPEFQSGQLDSSPDVAHVSVFQSGITRRAQRSESMQQQQQQQAQYQQQQQNGSSSSRMSSARSVSASFFVPGTPQVDERGNSSARLRQVGVEFVPGEGERTSGIMSSDRRMTFSELVFSKYNIKLDEGALEAQGMADLQLTEQEWAAAFARYRVRRQHHSGSHLSTSSTAASARSTFDPAAHNHLSTSSTQYAGMHNHSSSFHHPGTQMAGAGVRLPHDCPSCAAVLAGTRKSNLGQDFMPALDSWRSSSSANSMGVLSAP